MLDKSADVYVLFTHKKGKALLHFTMQLFCLKSAGITAH